MAHDRPTLLERDAEVASLDSLIEQSAAGAARLALIEGPAGIGKSRLLAVAAERGAEHGFRVLFARGSELEREFPFGVVRQLFEPHIVEADARAAALAGSAAAAANVFAPPQPGGGTAGAADASFATLHGLYWLTVNVAASQPLFLSIDDLHWCDAASLRFIAYLTRRMDGLELLVATTLRPAEPGADAALLGELAGDPLTATVRPAPLSGDAVATLVRGRLGEDSSASFSAACNETTAGNPLLLEELLRALAAEGVSPDVEHVGVVRKLGPRAASRSVLVRLARLPAEAVAVARAVAVLGDGAELGVAAKLAEIDPRAAAEATRALAQAEILRPDPPLGFVHPLVAAAVYADLPPGERELQHERAARLLRSTGAPAEQIAAHLLAMPARGEAWAVDVLQEAGRDALRKGGTESATAYLSRALAEPPEPVRRSSVLLELGVTEFLLTASASVEHLREAFELHREPYARALIGNILGRALLFSGDPKEAVSTARRTQSDLPDELGDLRRGLEAFELVAMMFAAEEPQAARERFESYRRLPEDSLGSKMLAAAAALDWTYAGGPADRCAELALAALEGGTLMAADSGLIGLAAITSLCLANDPNSERVWEEMLADAHQRGSQFAMTGFYLWHGWFLLESGALVEAEGELRAGIEGFELYGNKPIGDPYVFAFLAAVLRERGDLAGARAALDQAKDGGDKRDGTLYWLRSKLELLAAEGRDAEALACAEEIAARRPEVRHPGVFRWRPVKAEVLDRMGRREEALDLIAEDLEIAREVGAPVPLGRSLRILGQLEREQGLDHLREAVGVLEAASAPLELAKALSAQGTALRLGRKPTEAREPLQRAIELATACGAEPLLERARSELYATGARPRRQALKGITSLTPSEGRVARLAAEGQTNKEIAQALYVTPKTVEVHLSNTYRKLEIRGRRELGGVLEAGA